MYYIVGLGNPGAQYESTRHNVGWQALDHLIAHEQLPALVDSSQYAGRTSEGVLAGEEVAILYPSTYMNKSGSAVAKLVPRSEIDRLIVVHDDVDLPLGVVKVSTRRGAGGNNGVASIINTFGSKDFVRVRIGIAPVSLFSGEPRRPTSGAAMTKHVLGRFSLLERRKLDEVYQKTGDAIKIIITEGVEAAMNRCNA